MAILIALIVVTIILFIAAIKVAEKYGEPSILDRIWQPVIECPDANKDAINRYAFSDGKCVRPIHTHTVDSKTPSCPDGWDLGVNTQDGGKYPSHDWPHACIPRRDYFPLKTTWGQCPNDTVQIQSYDSGKKLCNFNKCPDGWDKNEHSGMTFCKRAAGFKDSADDMISALTCKKNPQHPNLKGRCYGPCKANYNLTDGGTNPMGICTRAKSVFAHKQCADDQEFINDRCYNACPAGYDTETNRCFDRSKRARVRNFFNKYGFSFVNKLPLLTNGLI